MNSHTFDCKHMEKLKNTIKKNIDLVTFILIEKKNAYEIDELSRDLTEKLKSKIRQFFFDIQPIHEKTKVIWSNSLKLLFY